MSVAKGFTANTSIRHRPQLKILDRVGSIKLEYKHAPVMLIIGDKRFSIRLLIYEERPADGMYFSFRDTNKRIGSDRAQLVLIDH